MGQRQKHFEELSQKVLEMVNKLNSERSERPDAGAGASAGEDVRLSTRKLLETLNLLQTRWQQAKTACASRGALLTDACEAQQYYADAQDADSWLHEKLALAHSDDVGRDVSGVQSLIVRHNALFDEIRAFAQDMQRLDAAVRLMTRPTRQTRDASAPGSTPTSGSLFPYSVFPPFFDAYPTNPRIFTEPRAFHVSFPRS